MGLSPKVVALSNDQADYRVRIWYENVGSQPARVHDHSDASTWLGVIFAVEKAGRQAFVDPPPLLDQYRPPGDRVLNPGETFSEEFPLKLATVPSTSEPLRLPLPAPEETIRLQAGFCRRIDATGAKNWNASETIKSGVITVTRGGTQKLSATVHALSGEDFRQVRDRPGAGPGLSICPVGKTPVSSWVERVVHADRYQGELLDASDRAWLLFRAPDFSAPDPLDKVFTITRAERAGNSILIECRLNFYSGPRKDIPPVCRPLTCIGLGRLQSGEYQVSAVVRYFSYTKAGKPEDAKPVAEGAAPSLMQYKLAFRVLSFAERLMADPKLDKGKPLVRFTVENYDGSQQHSGRMIVANSQVLMGSDESGLAAVRETLAELPAVAERELGRAARVRAEVAEPEDARLKPLAESIRAEIKRAGLDGAPAVQENKSD